MIPVIICGGAGTRLWPVSREAHPKPLMRLADGQSLVQKTFLRASALPGVKQVLTVTGRRQSGRPADQLPARALGPQHDRGHCRCRIVGA
jgi:mannose-1-phosphate guanylyltransferase